MAIIGQRELANYMPIACSVNKVLLEHSLFIGNKYAHLFTYHLWLLSHCARTE